MINRATAKQQLAASVALLHMLDTSDFIDNPGLLTPAIESLRESTETLRREIHIKNEPTGSQNGEC